MSSDTLTYDDLSPRDQALIDEAGGGNQTVVSARMVRALNGNGNAAIMLSQLLYWSRHKAGEDGWFYRTRSDMEERCGLGKTAQKSAAETLQALGFVETDLRGMPRRKHYRLHLERIVSALAGDEPVRVQAREQDRGHGREQDRTHGREQDRGHGRDPNRKEQREEQGKGSSGGRAPAREEPSGDSLPDADVDVSVNQNPFRGDPPPWFPEDGERFLSTMADLYDQFDEEPAHLQQLARNQWWRIKDNSRQPDIHKGTIEEHLDEYPWPKVVAAYVMARRASGQPQDYADAVLDRDFNRSSETNPENSSHEQHADEDPKQRPAENHERIAAAIDAAFDK